MISYNKLWKLLIDKGLKKSQLRADGVLNSNQLAKLSKNEPVNVEILVKLCKYLGCASVDELMEIIPDSEEERK